jgi:pseudouridine-5'-phosphate glycosidase
VAGRGHSGRGRRAGSAGCFTVGDLRWSAPQLNRILKIAPPVIYALRRGGPIVALETSIVGQGLPHPANLDAARACEAAIKDEGAVPATVAVLDGQIHVGLNDDELERVAADSIKVSTRDLGPAVARGQTGATTVAATVRAASMAGLKFMATGGIGGIHRNRPEDQSADLEEIRQSGVFVFCSGAKIILDLALTLERLESLGVPVLGYGTDEFPAFYTRHTGLPISARVDGPADTAAVLRSVGAVANTGAVVAIPPPSELDGAEEITRRAVSELADIRGGDVTPRVLARIAELSGGKSVEINVDLVVNNARVAAQVARAYVATSR